jgi:ABC-type sugar transport system ATPase subunit
MLRAPRILVLDNPTRGVDAGAREEIYRILRQLAETGVALVAITDDLPELIGLADRIVVMRDGRIVGQIDASAAAKPAEETLVAMMLGTSLQAVLGAGTPARMEIAGA